MIFKKEGFKHFEIQAIFLPITNKIVQIFPNLVDVIN